MQELIVPYCERLASGAEPINTVSNVFYAISSLLCVYQLCHFGHQSRHSLRPAIHCLLWILSLLPLALSVGSALFHATPSILTQTLDIIPIALFIAIAFGLVLRLHFHMNAVQLTSVLLLWIAASAIASVQQLVLPHSLVYVPTLLLIMLFSVCSPQWRKVFLQVTFVFGAALTFRVLDLPLCQHVSIGVHWLWHALSAIALAYAFIAVLRISNDSLAP